MWLLPNTPDARIVKLFIRKTQTNSIQIDFEQFIQFFEIFEAKNASHSKKSRKEIITIFLSKNRLPKIIHSFCAFLFAI